MIEKHVETIRVENISKHFGGVPALRDVSVTFHKGEIHALVGENGAGKSTLMKILAGVYQPDEGKIYLNHQQVTLDNPLVAQKLGVSIVFQELNLFPALSVYRNIFINREMTARFRLLDRKSMVQISRELIESMGLDIDPEKRVGSLSTAERQVVEIARAISHDVDILILDEPNSALGEIETEMLFATLRNLRERGLTIIFVSHRLEEVFKIADRITVLRDGQLIATEEIQNTSIPNVISMMIGRKLEEIFPQRKGKYAENEVVLKVDQLTKYPFFQAIDLELHRGEILGMVGLEGCGKDELFQTLFGLMQKDVGELVFEDKAVRGSSVKSVIEMGWALIPPDRRKQGVMVDWPIFNNVILVILDRIRSRLGIINYRKAREIIDEFISRLNIVTDSHYKKVNQLSGGNQQKIVLAKWLATKPKLLLLNDPTRGIDVGTKTEIYRLITELADNGLSILFTSSEVDEVLGLADRIIVLYKGKQVYEAHRGEFNREEVLHYINSGVSSGLNYIREYQFAT